jgi:hypothetical protein
MNIGISGNGKDRYDFISLVDEIFKESLSIEDTVSRYVQMKKDLDETFRQNIALKTFESEDTE